MYLLKLKMILAYYFMFFSYLKDNENVVSFNLINIIINSLSSWMQSHFTWWVYVYDILLSNQNQHWNIFHMNGFDSFETLKDQTWNLDDKQIIIIAKTF